MNDLPWIQTNESFLKKLSAIEIEKLKKQECVSTFKIAKLELEAQKNWDKFYKRNADHFFKDRNWTKNDLEILLSDVNLNAELAFLDAGCGVGNTIFPLLLNFSNWLFYGIDFSKNALDILNQRALQTSCDIKTALIDLTADNIESSSLYKKFDIISLIFVLSAITPEKQEKVVRNLKQCLKIGASVIVRDYGIYDYAMLRFGRNSKLGEKFYCRQDGTRTFFFEKEEVNILFKKYGFEMKRCEYLYKKTVNHKENICVDRIFIQARFILKNY